MQVKEILHEIVSSVQPDIGDDDIARCRSDTVAQTHGLTESEKDVRFFYHFTPSFFYYSSFSAIYNGLKIIILPSLMM